MRRFVAGWIFSLLASGLPSLVLAQSGTAGDKGAARSAAGVAVPLEKTEWRLIRLGRAAVKGDELHRPPEIVLDPESHRASGSGGCNRLTGGYEVKGEELKFGQMASTRMACVSGMETEQKFLAALEKVKKWNIAGRQLELMDDSGAAVAVLESKEPKSTQ